MKIFQKDLGRYLVSITQSLSESALLCGRFVGQIGRTMQHCEFEDFIRNRKLSKYLGASKWKNEVMVIKNTPNKNDWPRAILEKRQEKKFSS